MMKRTGFSRVLLPLALLLILLCASGPVSILAAAASDGLTYNEPGTYPIATTVVPLKIFMSMSSQTDYDTNEFTLHIEEKTGIDLIFETCPAAEASEKLNLLLTAGDYPDAIFSSGVNENRYGTDEGILVDLTPYFDRLPILNSLLDDYPNLLSDMKALDGKTYMLPAFDNCLQCSYSGKMWVNTTHLEAMGESAPTTTDEFYELCKKFKALDPANNPFVAFDGWVSDPFTYLAGAFFEYQWNDYGLAVKDNQIITYANTDAYRDALIYVNKLYMEGLLNEDCYTLEELMVPEILSEEGEPILFVPSGSRNFADVRSNPEIFGHFYPIEPIAGPSGHRTAMYAPINPGPAFCVTTACEYPEAAVRFAEVFYDREEFLNAQLGLKGTYWDDPTPGAVGQDGKPAIYRLITSEGIDIQNNNWIYRGIYNWLDLRVGAQAPDVIDLANPLHGEPVVYRTAVEMYVPYSPTETQPVRRMKYTVEESASIQTIAVEVNKVIEENKSAFITGVKDPNDDSAWNEYVASLESVGQPTLMEVYQAAYDRKYGN